MSDELWVLDLPRRRWIGFEYVDDVPRQRRVIQFADRNTILDAVWWRASVLASGFYIQGRFAVFDGAGVLLRYGGAPVEINEYPDVEVAYHLNRARVGVTSDSVVVLARLLRPQLEFYDLSGRHVHTTNNVPAINNDVAFAEDSLGRVHVLPTERTRYEYLDLAVGSSHVVALYSGRSENTHGSAATRGNQLHVFSLHGSFERAIPVDADLEVIEVDESQGLLYGIGFSERNAKQALYAFRLNDILPPTDRDTVVTKSPLVGLRSVARRR